MKTKFKLTPIVENTTKAAQLLDMLQKGEKGNMQYVAKKLKTSIHGVRSFVHSLRTKGYDVLTRDLGSNRTEYFLADVTRTTTIVNSKAHYSLAIPRGKYKFEVV